MTAGSEAVNSAIFFLEIITRPRAKFFSSHPRVASLRGSQFSRARAFFRVSLALLSRRKIREYSSVAYVTRVIFAVPFYFGNVAQ